MVLLQAPQHCKGVVRNSTTRSGVIRFRTMARTRKCGILDNLLPEDVVLADRGFDITDSVGMMQAKLHIPAFTKGKDQLCTMELDETRTIANVRNMKNASLGMSDKVFYLQSTLPIDFVTK